MKPPTLETMDTPEPTAPATGPAQAVVLALTTEASEEKAEALARALLERRLVACVSLIDLLSARIRKAYL